MKQYSDLVSVTDVEALDSLPEFTTICGEIEDDDTTADPMHLTKDYRESANILFIMLTQKFP